jgi:hypothetical protein
MPNRCAVLIPRTANEGVVVARHRHGPAGTRTPHLPPLDGVFSPLLEFFDFI